MFGRTAAVAASVAGSVASGTDEKSDKRKRDRDVAFHSRRLDLGVRLRTICPIMRTHREHSHDKQSERCRLGHGGIRTGPAPGPAECPKFPAPQAVVTRVDCAAAIAIGPAKRRHHIPSVSRPQDIIRGIDYAVAVVITRQGVDDHQFAMAARYFTLMNNPTGMPGSWTMFTNIPDTPALVEMMLNVFPNTGTKPPSMSILR